MANNNSPFGFIGSRIAEQENEFGTYTITSGYGTSLFIGDPVIYTTGLNGLANLVIATPGQKITGFFQGVTYSDATGVVRRTNYWLAGTVATNIQASVSDNPFTRYRVQLSGATYLDSYIGQSMDFVAGTGSTVSGSAYELDITTVGAGKGFLITNVYQAANNADSANAIVEVVPMLHQYRNY
jgi:hypothetical protein